MKRVGLFPGSFNPLTNAHLAVAAAAREVAALDAVVWSISAVTVDKERVERASIPDRLAQLGAFARTTPADVVAIINRGLYVEEAEALRAHLAGSATLFMLIGFDKIVQIFDPRYYADRDAALRELFALAHILVAPRDGQGAEALDALLAQPENRAYSSFVRLVPVSPEHTHDSSTAVRELAAVQPLSLRTLRRLLPPEGLALVQTGAYSSTAEDAEAAEPDLYAWRERWLNALDVVQARPGIHFPPLHRLIARTVRDTAVGARLRAWLAQPATTPLPREVRRILMS